MIFRSIIISPWQIVILIDYFSRAKSIQQLPPSPLPQILKNQRKSWRIIYNLHIPQKNLNEHWRIPKNRQDSRLSRDRRQKSVFPTLISISPHFPSKKIVFNSNIDSIRQFYQFLAVRLNWHSYFEFVVLIIVICLMSMIQYLFATSIYLSELNGVYFRSNQFLPINSISLMKW